MHRSHFIATIFGGALASGLILASAGAAWALPPSGGAVLTAHLRNVARTTVTDPVPSTTDPTTTTVPVTTTTTVAAGTGAPSDPVCSRFVTAQQTVEAGLTARVTQLKTLEWDVSIAKHLTSGDQLTLSSDLGNELSGIQTLQTQAEEATTCLGLRTIAQEMVDTYRVYLVMTPQVHLVIVADAATWASTYLASLEPTLEGAITAAGAAGKNIAGAQAAFADLEAQVTNAQSAVNGVVSDILAQTPAGYPGNKDVFVGARNSLTSAQADLHDADKDFHTIMSVIG